jgi:hypothetical protein
MIHINGENVEGKEKVYTSISVFAHDLETVGLISTSLSPFN